MVNDMSLKYLMVSPDNVAWCDSVKDLGIGLLHRRDFNCLIFVDSDWNYLKRQAELGYNRIISSNSNETHPLRVIAIPKIINESTFLSYQSNLQLPPQNIDVGFWAVSALNGFCLACSINQVCGLLCAGELVYPIFVWCQNYENAVEIARSNYVKRFYYRYDSRYERLDLPQKMIESFKDGFFPQREERMKNQSEEFKKFKNHIWDKSLIY